MAQAEPLVISMGTILLGLVSLSLALFLVRLVQKKMPFEQVPRDDPLPIETENHAEGIILIQSGGRIGYMNRQAREWFGTSNGKSRLFLRRRFVKTG